MMLECFQKNLTKGARPILLMTDERLSSWLKEQPKLVKNWVEQTGFKAQCGEICLLPNLAGDLERVLVGIDHLDNIAWQRFRTIRLRVVILESFARLIESNKTFIGSDPQYAIVIFVDGMNDFAMQSFGRFRIVIIMGERSRCPVIPILSRIRINPQITVFIFMQGKNIVAIQAESIFWQMHVSGKCSRRLVISIQSV